MRIAATVLLLAAPVLAQIEAKEISEEEASKAANSTAAAPGSMASPMQLEVPLKTKSGTNVLQFLRTMSEVWRTTETATYVVDRARVTGIEVRKLKAKKGRMRIGIDAGLSTEWFRQDIDLTIALVVGDQEIAKRTWDDLTIGNDAGAILTFGSSSKERGLEIDLPEADWIALEANDTPKVRVIVDVQEGDED